MTKLIKDLIRIPEQVHRGDFVLRLTEGVAHPEATLATYVVTPQLKEAFGRALGLIRSAIEDRTSKAAYLHGSFGSGKSHFMAVLHAILQHVPAAREAPELRSLVADNAAWLDGRRILLVPFHLIGTKSMEASILGGYVAHVRERHQDCPLPGVFLADGIFEDARRLRASMGDDGFFRALSGGRETGGEWGDFDAPWDARSFEDALAAPAHDERRIRLVGDLVQHLFRAYQDVAVAGGESYVPLDQGLEIITRHAKELGYDALVLFLDELILWLASHVADMAFVNREGQKLAKLVEAQHARRPIPLISFVARQRDLRDLVGEHVPGAEQLAFADVLRYWEGRFQTIPLEDRNLPAIVERRLLAPRSAEAKAELDRAFEQTKKVREEVMTTLLTSTADQKMFRQVYPFSPALVETLVKVSGVLQRERTALRAMVQLLVNRRNDLALGDVVPVGDLFDVMAEGDEPFTEGLRLHFGNAKRLWTRKLLPMLERQAGLSEADLKSLPADDPRARRFQVDGRFLKTLLLAALVPDVETLRNLSVRRLSALNHGSIRVQIPGQESRDLLARCNGWAAEVGEIKVSDDPVDPTVQIHLVGVDTATILERGKSQDNHGNRRARLRELLFQELGIESRDELILRHGFAWRGTRREVEVHFGNIRELPSSTLVADGEVWKVVIDFPFDVEGFGPQDDLRVLEKFRPEIGATRTFCWIPCFLTRELQADLGTLVTIEHVLKPTIFPEAALHLAPADRATAKGVLENQRDQLRAKLRLALESAYGVRAPDPRLVDLATFEPGEGLQSLEPTFRPAPPVGNDLRSAFAHLLDQLLRYRFPRHPDFKVDLKSGPLRKVFEVLAKGLAAGEHRVVVEKDLRPIMQKFAEPLLLGTMHEDAFVPDDFWLHLFTREAGRGAAPLTVARLRAAIDQPTPFGLPKNAQNLLILLFAEQSTRTVFHHGGPIEADLDDLPDDAELREAVLPTLAEWEEIAGRAHRLFGLVPGTARTPTSVARLSTTLKTKAAEHLKPCAQYRELLRAALDRLAIPAATAPRYETATATLALVELLAAGKETEILSRFRGARIATNAEAMGTSLKRAADLAFALERASFDVLLGLGRLTDARAEAAGSVLARVREALTRDELTIPLGPALGAAIKDAVALLAPPVAKPSAPPAAGPEQGSAADLDAKAAAPILRRLQDELTLHPGRRLSVTWTFTGPKKDHP